MAGSELLFVYGTLRPPQEGLSVRSFNFPKVVPFLISVRPAELPNADLYHLGSFPGAIPGTRRITGDLLEINPFAFDILDPLEGHPDLYYRAIVQVLTENGPEDAWVYWAPEDLAKTGRLIESGDWLEKAGAQ